jgi:hypothetical protein
VDGSNEIKWSLKRVVLALVAVVVLAVVAVSVYMAMAIQGLANQPSDYVTFTVSVPHRGHEQTLVFSGSDADAMRLEQPDWPMTAGARFDTAYVSVPHDSDLEWEHCFGGDVTLVGAGVEQTLFGPGLCLAEYGGSRVFRYDDPVTIRFSMNRSDEGRTLVIGSRDVDALGLDRSEWPIGDLEGPDRVIELPTALQVEPADLLIEYCFVDPILLIAGETSEAITEPGYCLDGELLSWPRTRLR